jgi:hypothetical protein
MGKKSELSAGERARLVAIFARDWQDGVGIAHLLRPQESVQNEFETGVSILAQGLVRNDLGPTASSCDPRRFSRRSGSRRDARGRAQYRQAYLFAALHSGGASLAYVPLGHTHEGPDAEVNRRSVEALRAFDTEYSVVM